MNKVKIDFFGREFNLNVIFDYYEGEEILPSQKETLNTFLEEQHFLNDDLNKLKKYCLDRNENEIGEKIDNIFKYVIPVDIYVTRKKGIVAVMCKYKFDLEHGIALVYKNEKLIEIGMQDIVL